MFSNPISWFPEWRWLSSKFSLHSPRFHQKDVWSFLRACSPYGPMKSAIVVPHEEAYIEKNFLKTILSFEDVVPLSPMIFFHIGFPLRNEGIWPIWIDHLKFFSCPIQVGRSAIQLSYCKLAKKKNNCHIYIMRLSNEPSFGHKEWVALSIANCLS